MPLIPHLLFVYTAGKALRVDVCERNLFCLRTWVPLLLAAVTVSIVDPVLPKEWTMVEM